MGGSASDKNKIFSQALKQKMPGIASGGGAYGWEATGGGRGGGGGGGGKKPKPPVTPPGPPVDNALHWAFPQYTQQWAFTPPTPSPYMPPPAFDKTKYGFKEKTKK